MVNEFLGPEACLTYQILMRRAVAASCWLTFAMSYAPNRVNRQHNEPTALARRRFKLSMIDRPTFRFPLNQDTSICLLYTSDAADEL